LLFFVWLHLPVREIYEVPVHIILPLCIMFPLLHFRNLFFVPIIAFVPDITRAFGFELFHSPISLPVVFLAALLPFINKPKVALTAGYAATAIIASHLIIDARKHTTVSMVYGYPFSDLMLYTFLLTLGSVVLAQVLSRALTRRR
jgi:hypothetical protein